MSEESTPTVLHLTSSRFYGGPERQMLGLAQALASNVNTTFASFSEGGLCDEFLKRVRQDDFEGTELKHDTPRLVRAKRELQELLTDRAVDIAICHGYKANLLGLLASRKLGLPVISVSRGWTGESARVRLYEMLDRRLLHRMDRVVCVSDSQKKRVIRSGVQPAKVDVIHNSVRAERFGVVDESYWQETVRSRFPNEAGIIIGAAGRLSPEKGFEILIEAISRLNNNTRQNVCVALFGDGFLREKLQFKIDELGLSEHVVLFGFTDNLDQLMPHFDLFVQSSYTEGLPNVLLEASAAGVPIVATNVGGTPEVIIDGHTGVLVPPGDSDAMANAIASLLDSAQQREAMTTQAKQNVQEKFTFAHQAEQYRRIFEQVLDERHANI